MLIQMKLGSKEMYVNNKKVINDVAPFAQNQRTFVPVRFIAENFGANVLWDNKEQAVTILNRKKFFPTVDEAAYDWAMYFNPFCIAIYKEAYGIIYKNELGYYWDTVQIGHDKEVAIDVPATKKGVASIHSHSGGKPALTDTMSKGDLQTAKKTGRPLYMVDSGGKLWVNDPNWTFKDTEKRYTQKLVAEGLPVDCKYTDMTKSAVTMRQYFKDGYFGLDSEFTFGYAVDYYNRMYMDNQKYYDVKFNTDACYNTKKY